MKLKDLVKQEGGSGSDLWNVPMHLLDANPDNIRMDTTELREHIRMIADSIIGQGFMRSRPLTVRQAEGRLIVVDGNCRLLAARVAIEEGKEILTLPCVSEAPGTNDADRVANMLIANSGKGHTELEYAAAVKMLLSYGWTDELVAKKLGRSRQWVSNVLETASLPADVQAEVAAGAVSPTLARTLARKHGAGTAAVIGKAKAATGRGHVTARHVRAAEPAPDGATATQEPAAVAEKPADRYDALRAAVVAFLAAYDAGDGFGDELATMRELVE